MSAAIATAPARTTRAQIDVFLQQKRFALIGMSRDPRDISRALATEFKKRGYEVLPVNPAMTEVDGARCFARVQQIEPAVAAALLTTSPSVTESVVRDCVEAGVTHIWMYRAGGTGAVSQKAVEFCREHGVNVIAGECPFMFFSKPGLPHNLHGLIKKLVGTYPR